MRWAQKALIVVAVGVGLPLVDAQVALPDLPNNVTSICRNFLETGRRLVERGEKAQALQRFETFLPKKPTLVFINVSTAPKDLRASYKEAVLQSMDAWNKAVSDLVEFRETQDEDAAQINLAFETDVASRKGTQWDLVCGVTHVETARSDLSERPPRNETTWKAEVRIAVYPHGRQDHRHAPDSVTHVAGHELGHFLGLDESSNGRDIMGNDNHRGAAAVKPSENDVKRYRELRSVVQQWMEAAKS